MATLNFITNLKNLAYNILKTFEDSLVDNIEIPELDECSKCSNKIVLQPIKAVTILSCGHIFHRICIEKELLLSRKESCPYPNCNNFVDILEEFSRQDSGLSTSSIIGRMEKNLTIASQGNPDEDMVDVNDSRSENTPISEADEHSRSNNRSANLGSNKRSLEDVSSKKAKKRIKKEDSPSLKRLITELTTETSETFGGAERSAVVPQKQISEVYSKNTTDFLRLNDNITHAESRNESTNREVIRCYYCFGDILLQRLNYYKGLDHSDLASKTLVNEEVRKQIGDKISNDTLRKRTEKARKIFALLNNGFKDKGENMIIRIRTFTASSISKLSWEEIEYVSAEIIRSAPSNQEF
ncbi:4053_t:CDS:1 [Paraglomus occultum]|uniref:4053_t:CDS:1 n=1 Tax=Paraglomus occultum TaxID=144539 RepID=A0A9N9H8P0_9GLOM|nr:4053_t:CDS:1 [Paraglomus occultum]